MLASTQETSKRGNQPQTKDEKVKLSGKNPEKNRGRNERTNMENFQSKNTVDLLPVFLYQRPEEHCQLCQISMTECCQFQK